MIRKKERRLDKTFRKNGGRERRSVVSSNSLTLLFLNIFHWIYLKKNCFGKFKSDITSNTYLKFIRSKELQVLPKSTESGKL